jgi:hypothetical protein
LSSIDGKQGLQRSMHLVDLFANQRGLPEHLWRRKPDG